MSTTFVEAITQALREEMTKDSRVILLGEDIGRYGGAFKATENLFQEFGEQRVIDTPIAEAAVVGAAIGAAMSGLRPVAELQFIDFISCGGFDLLVSVAAKSRYRTGVGVPMVLRGPCGGGVRGGAFHSTCPEMWAVTTPGIKVVFPGTVYDAKGLLKSAIRDPDPVLFLEHKLLYRRLREDLPQEDYSVPLGVGIERTQGDDATLITYGAMLQLCLQAAHAFKAQGKNIRVIDLRTLVPLDEKIIIKAAIETGRIVIVHEHSAQGGFAGEITALINEKAFDYLDAPILRVAALNTPVPHAPPLEDAYLPSVAKIQQAVQKVLSY